MVGRWVKVGSRRHALSILQLLLKQQSTSSSRRGPRPASWEVWRQWQGSNPRPLRPNAEMLSAWPPTARDLKLSINSCRPSPTIRLGFKRSSQEMVGGTGWCDLTSKSIQSMPNKVFSCSLLACYISHDLSIFLLSLLIFKQMALWDSKQNQSTGARLMAAKFELNPLVTVFHS